MSPDEARSEFNSNIPTLGGLLSALEVIESRVLTLTSAMSVYVAHSKRVPHTPAPSVPPGPTGTGPSASEEAATRDVPVHDDPADQVSDPGQLPSSEELNSVLRRKALKALQLATTRKPRPASRRRGSARGRRMVKSRKKKRR